MTTKDLILQASLCLFNQEGFETTSARQIARVVRISQGNLRYHYPSKEAIGQQLFDQFYREYCDILETSSAQKHEVSIADMLDTYLKLFTLYDEYRFILQDLWSLTRSLPAIKKTLQLDYEKRRAALAELLAGLAAAGQLETPDSPGLFEAIISQQLFLGECWLSHSGIYFEGEPEQEIRRYLEQWVLLLLPYLTVPGLEALMEYAREHAGTFQPEFYQLIQFHFDRRPSHESESI
ncbi:TetR/AcrR family transcriptional regulator [Flavilitoribacter nigricans]|uniref:HTH tetR-type domain-containing protein n=1 Tax=Flavilitoribacter nigricans (strain ATCC 23147 / DSM 23189 / NBRC 102662 / NCIMB 1420 / SS-2) TaxID=1122177 RepID=A0A2D0N0I3_FLAN2|nr:TetR/AcrR family transcriptional regulator [Flavilitoribacter nigricans]PHN01659.1 hypothetical protein CRP01_36185 [Flavilitoribacter nigricans DSM 23189 = NBRC 102662]